jgi:MSHA biogenesis protein MshP
MTYRQHNQSGFSMVAAIFLLVVLAALGAFMVTFSNTQHLTSAQDIQGSRAYWAARAGTAWAIGRISATPTTCPLSPTTFNVDGFALVVTCVLTPYDEGSMVKRVFNITSTATAGGAVGSIGRVERSLSATVEY